MTAILSDSVASPRNGIVALTRRGLIRARGREAASFLQGQLTSDVASLGPSQARLAGYCSPKGRLLASFVVWRPAVDEVLLACSADLLAATLKRLRMFVLRAQCSLDDASAELPLHGIACADAAVAAAVLGDEAAAAPPWQRVERDGASLIRLPDAAGCARWLWAGPSAPPALPPLPEAEWHRLEVASGIATVEAATADLFVPQMLNFELLGGVDFRKGCYPGQEIVARSQYRGTLKRRSLLFEVDTPAQAGQEVFDAADPGQPAGLVVNAAQTPGAGTLALVEVKIAALDAGARLHLGSADGPSLRPAGMPYDVPLHAVDPA